MEKRLQSLKLPRDLTLGGTKPKKLYAPNITVTRRKEKVKDVVFKKEDKQRYSNKFNGISLKKINKIDRFIQSSGIFSEGVGNDAIKKTRHERSYMPRDESHQHIPIPTVKKDEWKVDNKLETRVYDDILGCDVLSEDEEPMPFKPHTWNENDLKECIAHSKVVNKPEIKLEHVDLQNGEFKMGGNVIPKDFRDSDAVGDNNPTLTLWNLPDSFAGKSFSDDPNVKKFFDYKLTDMQEGQIGKLVIRKSGKLEVYIGSGKYDLEPTNLQSFSENLMEIDLDATSSTSVLGSIQNRYILNPDWDDLLS